eukprot:GHUV01009951.1.p1 GENE.GHUV01009951.1~~GHUV01009951.1.p1  ORF type:complete len:352 (+),score=97.37 GHUV01009951.1:150-1205(+)
MHPSKPLRSGSARQGHRYCFVHTHQKPRRPFAGCRQLLQCNRAPGKQRHEARDNQQLVHCSTDTDSGGAAHDQQDISAGATAPSAAASGSSVPIRDATPQQQPSASSEHVDQQDSTGSQHALLAATTTSPAEAAPASVAPDAAVGGRRPTHQAAARTHRAQRSQNSVDTSIDMTAEARRYLLVSLAQFSMGSVLVSAPHAFMAAALNAVPTALEVLFARLMGLALLFRGLLALMLRSASERGRLHGTSAQRVMLGCILPSISHIIAFKTVYSQWGMQWNWALMFLYPSVLGAELYTHLLAFQVYNPYFLLKLLWPLCVALVTAQLMPPIPPADQIAAKVYVEYTPQRIIPS